MSVTTWQRYVAIMFVVVWSAGGCTKLVDAVKGTVAPGATLGVDETQLRVLNAGPGSVSADQLLDMVPETASSRETYAARVQCHSARCKRLLQGVIASLPVRELQKYRKASNELSFDPVAAIDAIAIHDSPALATIAVVTKPGVMGDLLRWGRKNRQWLEAQATNQPTEGYVLGDFTKDELDMSLKFDPATRSVRLADLVAVSATDQKSGLRACEYFWPGGTAFAEVHFDGRDALEQCGEVAYRLARKVTLAAATPATSDRSLVLRLRAPEQLGAGDLTLRLDSAVRARLRASKQSGWLDKAAGAITNIDVVRRLMEDSIVQEVPPRWRPLARAAWRKLDLDIDADMYRLSSSVPYDMVASALTGH